LATKDEDLWVRWKDSHGHLGTDSTTDIRTWTKIASISGGVVSVFRSGFRDTWNWYEVTDRGYICVSGFNLNYVLGTRSNGEIKSGVGSKDSVDVRKVATCSGVGNFRNEAYEVTNEGNLFVAATYSSNIAANPRP
jgi:hypothetical protein